MATDWEDVRAAIATKAALVVPVRQSTATRTDTRGPLPAIKILAPTYRLVAQPNAWIEEYTLTFPAELLVAQPAGKGRGDAEFVQVARLLQKRWWTDVKLGLDSVRHSYIESIEPDLDAYAETGLTGGRITFVVEMRETLDAART